MDTKTLAISILTVGLAYLGLEYDSTVTFCMGGLSFLVVVKRGMDV